MQSRICRANNADNDNRDPSSKIKQANKLQL